MGGQSFLRIVGLALCMGLAQAPPSARGSIIPVASYKPPAPREPVVRLGAHPFYTAAYSPAGESRVYAPRPAPPENPMLLYLAPGMSAAVLLFLLIPIVRQAALRTRLLN